jgi:hypothetical protein
MYMDWNDKKYQFTELLPPKDEDENNIINFLSKPIWLSFNIKRNGNLFIIDTYFYNDVFLLFPIVQYWELIYVVDEY